MRVGDKIEAEREDGKLVRAVCRGNDRFFVTVLDSETSKFIDSGCYVYESEIMEDDSAYKCLVPKLDGAKARSGNGLGGEGFGEKKLSEKELSEKELDEILGRGSREDDGGAAGASAAAAAAAPAGEFKIQKDDGDEVVITSPCGGYTACHTAGLESFLVTKLDNAKFSEFVEQKDIESFAGGAFKGVFVALAELEVELDDYNMSFVRFEDASCKYTITALLKGGERPYLLKTFQKGAPDAMSFVNRGDLIKLRVDENLIRALDIVAQRRLGAGGVSSVDAGGGAKVEAEVVLSPPPPPQEESPAQRRTRIARERLGNGAGNDGWNQSAPKGRSMIPGRKSGPREGITWEEWASGGTKPKDVVGKA